MTLNQLGHRAYAIGFTLAVIGIVSVIFTLAFGFDRPHPASLALVGTGLLTCLTVGIVTILRDAWKEK